MKFLNRSLLLLMLANALTPFLRAGDPGPTQSAGAVSPPYHAAAINAPFPDNYYGADHGGSSVALSYPFVSRFGNVDHSRGVVTYECAPFTPRNSEGVYGMDVWLEASSNGGDWSPAGPRGGLADGAGSAYQPVNTPNPGPSPSYRFQWTFDSSPLPSATTFRVWAYVYLYNQGGGSQGNFYVGSSAGSLNTGLADDPPAIAWDPSVGSVNPSTVPAGQSYGVSATGTDDNGNLTSVQIWRNGQGFAAGGGGDGWSSSASGSSTDSSGTISYSAQATDAMGLTSPIIGLTVAVSGLLAQPAVSSLEAALNLGDSFTPAFIGGAGSGGWQFAIGDYTNFNAGATADTGTDLPSGTWIPAWAPAAAGSYFFWVSHNGDAQYAPSAVAGPYTLTVYGPDAPASPPVTTSPPPDDAPPLDPPVTSAPPPTQPDPTSPAPTTFAPATPAPAPSSSAPPPETFGTAPPSSPPAAPNQFNAPAPTTEIARIRFNATGRAAAVHSAGTAGSSLIWTDPTGVTASPWPSFTPAPPATIQFGQFLLPAPAQAH